MADLTKYEQLQAELYALKVLVTFLLQREFSRGDDTNAERLLEDAMRAIAKFDFRAAPEDEAGDVRMAMEASASETISAALVSAEKRRTRR